MKIILLNLAVVCFTLTANAQVIFTENFDNFSSLNGNGWTIKNSSEPIGSSSWGTTTHFPSYNGSQGSFAAVNYQSTGNVGVISNWLITPVINLKNGDVINFYSRTDHGTFPDRLELRISTNGESSTLPSSSSNSLGDFTTLALTINPNLVANGYPTVWTNYSYTVSELAEPVDCRIGFRYYVTNAGLNAPNGDMIGIDAMTISTTNLNVVDITSTEFSISPNPTQDIIYINSDYNIEKVECINILGRKMNIEMIDNKTVSFKNLSNGVYILEINANNKIFQKKVIKN